MIKISWENLIDKYKESDISAKKLPEFFNFYKQKDFKEVYEPAEDTFLLTDVLELEKEELINRKLNNTIELGCGSGFVSCFFLKMLNNSTSHYCVDINESALELTKRLFAQYEINANVMKSDLFENLGNITFDVILFNPVWFV